MVFYKTFSNGLKLVVSKLDGLMSVSAGIMVKTGSINESESDNGISHFLEHVMFKGTKNRSAFEISDCIDSIGAQINAFTSKEMTCYYTKSTSERLKDCLDVLSDIFFNSLFDDKELDRERGVIIEEINMAEDTPEDVCADLLAQSYYGDKGLGRTILGPAENIKRFSRFDVERYMDKYYTADNVVISISGNVNVDEVTNLVEKLFAKNFERTKSVNQITTEIPNPQHLFKDKKIEQTHISIAMPAIPVTSTKSDALNIANIVFGGGMSSRLFQTIREKLGLAYSVYSYLSQYKSLGTLEIFAGVNSSLKNKAFNAIVDEIKSFKQNGITEKEFLRGKEQMKSAFVFGRESTASQMLLYGRHLLFYDKQFDIAERLSRLDNVSITDVTEAINEFFNVDKIATATVGPNATPLM